MDRDAYVGFRSRRATAEHATLVRVRTSAPALQNKHLSLRRLFLYSRPIGAALYNPDCAGTSTASTIRFASVSAVAIAPPRERKLPSGDPVWNLQQFEWNSIMRYEHCQVPS